jgi:hypothetical protein
VEARVELAWLSNPATFPYNLQPRLAGTAFEVQGYVPSEPIHQEAVRMARQESGLQVIDGIKIHASLAPPKASNSPQILSRQAMGAVKRGLPGQTSHLSVSVWTNGQVLLKGTVPSLAAKLTASRCLRQVTGCTCVINQLRVAEPAAVAPPASVAAMSPLKHPAAVVASSGMISSPGGRQPPAVVPIMGQIILDGPGPAVPVIGQIILDTPAPQNHSAPPQPPLTITAQPPPNTLTEPPSMTRAEPAYAPASPSPWVAEQPPSITRIDSIQDRPRQVEPPSSSWSRLSAAPTVTPPPPREPANSPYTFHPTTWRRMDSPGPAQNNSDAPVRQAALSSNQGAIGNSEIRQVTALDISRPAPGSSTVIAPAVPATLPTLQSRPLIVSPGPTGVPQRNSQAAGAPSIATDTSKMVVLGMPSSQAAPSRREEPALLEPRVTTGLIVLDSPQVVPLPKANPDSEPQLAYLQERIARACGRRPTDLEVTCPARKTLRVRIAARDPKEAQRLSNAIFQLPELDPYEVSLDIPVVR